MDFLHSWYDNRCYSILQFGTSLIDLTLIQGHKSAKSMQSCANHFTKFSIDLDKFDLLLRPVDIMNPILTFICAFDIQGR